MANRNVSRIMVIAIALGLVSCRQEEADVNEIQPEPEQTTPKYVNRSNLDERLDQELQQNLYPYLDSHGREHQTVLVVSGKEQEVHVGSYSNGRFTAQETYEVSTGKKGFGHRHDSKQTPYGLLRVYGKAGGKDQKGEEFEKISKIFDNVQLISNS